MWQGVLRVNQFWRTLLYFKEKEAKDTCRKGHDTLFIDRSRECCSLSSLTFDGAQKAPTSLSNIQKSIIVFPECYAKAIRCLTGLINVTAT